MNFVIRCLLSMPAFYLIQTGLASKGYGNWAQVGISVAVLMIYDVGQRISK